MEFVTPGNVGAFTLLLKNQPPSLGQSLASQRTVMTAQPYTLRNGPSRVNHNLFLG